jgi:hypothetical protein
MPPLQSGGGSTLLTRRELSAGGFYTLLGLLLFAPPLIGHPSASAVTGYAFAMLYATSPW